MELEVGAASSFQEGPVNLHKRDRQYNFREVNSLFKTLLLPFYKPQETTITSHPSLFAPSNVSFEV